MSRGLVAKASVSMRASADKVWDAFTKPEIIKQYMFGADVLSDWKEGSSIVWKGEWQGRRYEDKGVILKLVPMHLIQYSHFSPLSGLPDKPENYHTATIELSSDKNRRLVMLTQDNNPDEEARQHSEQNWGMMLSSLKKGANFKKINIHCEDYEQKNSTRIGQHINAPRSRVYKALIDPKAIPKWKVHAGMFMQIHSFNAREGGTFRISLTYESSTPKGKTTAHTDTYHGRFVKLVPNEQVVEADEFETSDPRLRGEMKITITLADADGGTDLVAVHEELPEGLSADDNELGWKMAPAKLAALVETRTSENARRK